MNCEITEKIGEPEPEVPQPDVDPEDTPVVSSSDDEDVIPSDPKPPESGLVPLKYHRAWWRNPEILERVSVDYLLDESKGRVFYGKKFCGEIKMYYYEQNKRCQWRDIGRADLTKFREKLEEKTKPAELKGPGKGQNYTVFIFHGGIELKLDVDSQPVPGRLTYKGEDVAQAKKKFDKHGNFWWSFDRYGPKEKVLKDAIKEFKESTQPVNKCKRACRLGGQRSTIPTASAWCLTRLRSYSKNPTRSNKRVQTGLNTRSERRKATEISTGQLARPF